jgi:hypothetical protein
MTPQSIESIHSEKVQQAWSVYDTHLLAKARRNSAKIMQKLARSTQYDLFPPILSAIRSMNRAEENTSKEFVGFNSSFVRSCIVFYHLAQLTSQSIH